MTIYILLFLFCIILSYLADIHREDSNSTIYIGIIVFLMCLIGGLRDLGVGTDTLVYTEDYLNYAKDNSFFELLQQGNLDDYDKGYFLLNSLSSFFSSNYWFILFLTQLITIGLTYWGVYRLSNYYEISFVVFTFLFCFLFYNQTYNYMRQFCALGLLLFAFSFFIEQKYVKYLILQIIAFFFHSSSVLFIIAPMVYFVLRNFYGTTKMYLILVGYLCFIIFVVIDFYDILYYIADLGLYTMDYADRYGVESNFVESDGFPRTTVLLMLFPFFLYSLAFYMGIMTPQLFLFSIVIHFSYVAITSLAFYVIFLQRLAFYFYYIDVFFVAHIISHEQFNKKISLLYGLLAVYCWYNMFILNNDCETYPYSSSILGIGG